MYSGTDFVTFYCMTMFLFCITSFRWGRWVGRRTGLREGYDAGIASVKKAKKVDSLRNRRKDDIR